MRLYLHVGLPKTGTTFLQVEVFPKIQNVNYIHKLEFGTKFHENKINIVSAETLSGYALKPYGSDSRIVIADRLKRCFPDAKIIIGLRDKESWIKSLYSQYIKEGGIQKYSYWFENIFDKGFLDFHYYIMYLKSLFKEVYVYRFENLKKYPERTITGLCNFMGVDIPDYENKTYNASLGERQLKVLRFLNRFFKSCHNPNGLLPRHKKFNVRFLVLKFSRRKKI